MILGSEEGGIPLSTTDAGAPDVTLDNWIYKCSHRLLSWHPPHRIVN